MTNHKLDAGHKFPELSLKKLGGGDIDFLSPKDNCDWLLVIVYRGQHCPKCTQYLTELNDLIPKFNEVGVDVVAISGDSEAQAHSQIDKIKPSFDVGYGLTVEQMKTLGLYISNPRSEAETDHAFAEPGLFVINTDKAVQLIDISNAPFLRPDLMSIINGIGFIRDPEKNYPIRGTLTY